MFIIDWTLLFSIDSDLDVFNYNPTDSSFTALSVPTTAFTNYLIQLHNLLNYKPNIFIKYMANFLYY